MKKRSPRTIRIVYSAAAVIALAVCIVNFYRIVFVIPYTNDMCQWEPLPNDPDTYIITRVIKGGVTDKAGLRVGDTLVSINSVEINHKEQGTIIHKAKSGETMTYKLKRGPEIYTAHVKVVKSVNYVFIALFLLGFGFLVVGWVVLMVKPQGEIQRRFARFGILAMGAFGLQVMAIAIYGRNWWYWVSYVFFILIYIEAPVRFITFFNRFPVKTRLADKRWFIAILYAVSVTFLAFVFLVWYRVIPLGESRTAWLIFGLLRNGPLYFYIAGMVIFIVSYFRRVEKADRPKLRPILYGTIEGVAAFAYIIYVSSSDPLAFIFYPEHSAPTYFLLGVPLAFGYSVIRFRLMDVDLIIKRSLLYGIITAAVAAIYLLVVIGIGSVIGGMFGKAENELLTIVAIVAIAFLFDPIKRMAQAWIDRVFYQDRVNYQKALLEFSRELPSNTDLEHILSSTVSRISHTMHVEKVAVLLCHEEDGCTDALMNLSREELRFSTGWDGIIPYFEREKAALSLAIPEEDFHALPLAEGDKGLLREAGIVLAVPMFYKSELMGIILAGAKLSGKIYSQEDIDLLSTVASQAAIAIENARLLRTEVERQKMIEELNLARRIQLGLLPPGDPHVPGLDISGVSIPAQSVGGDYFDYIMLDPNRVLIIVGDVSGKGIPAALYMSKVQGMIRVVAGQYKSPRDILIHVNRYVHERLERNAFITIVLALFDMSDNTMTICRAGHTRPIFSNSGGPHFIELTGMGLGLEDGPTFTRALEEKQVQLTPGSMLLLYSDGLTESMNQAMEEFGEQRLMSSFTDIGGLEAREIQDLIVEKAHVFVSGAPQHDDLTLVVVKVKEG